MVAIHIAGLLKKMDIVKNILYFIDNASEKIGKTINIADEVFEIKAFEEGICNLGEKTVFLITCEKYEPVLDQIGACPSLNKVPVFLYSQINHDYIKMVCMEEKDRINGKNLDQIPKTIHYCWFGKSIMPPEFRNYIHTWKAKCPDYEIIEWNERNYDISKVNYIKQAYERGLYAFVTDYVRLDVLYNYGGFYFDVDVELLKNLDHLRGFRTFFTYGEWPAINTGNGCGAIPQCDIIRQMRDEPRSRINFIDDKGTPDLTTNMAYESRTLEQKGFKMDFSTQTIDGISVLSPAFFATTGIYCNRAILTDYTVAIHHCAGTWKDNGRSRNEDNQV